MLPSPAVKRNGLHGLHVRGLVQRVRKVSVLRDLRAHLVELRVFPGTPVESVLDVPHRLLEDL